ncbi:MAG: hypothetical protein WCE23_03710 [Candidatus Binatus sp.]|uniref:hypothetical protein n=1 Tax=Candidatus Binatus sp. TaxID=2811406 RepID=UPI003C75BCE8
MIPPIPKPPGPEPFRWRKPKLNRLPRAMFMTLIAGCKCRDGFVLAADTEITQGNIVYQDHKLNTYFSDRYGYDIAIGGAGDASYLTMASQRIRDAAAALDKPTCDSIRNAISNVMLSINDKELKYWEIDDENRPAIQLLIGIKDPGGGILVLNVDRTAVFEVNSWAFAGSGQILAAHLGEKLYQDNLSAAVTQHLIGQICREVKAKGTYVGGNTEMIATISSSLFKLAEPFFMLDIRDDRFLWGLDDYLGEAVRIALDRDKSKKALEKRIREIGKRLKGLRRNCEKERAPGGESVRITEFGSEYGNSFKDL